MRRDKTLLIGGGSHADIPVIHAAKRLGFTVVTSGNNPQDAGHAYSDEQHFVDYSDKEALLVLAERLSIDAIVASANDFSALSCAYVAQKLRLPGHDPLEVAEIVHHKDKFRTFALQTGLPVPKAVRVEKEYNSEDTADLVFPVLVKPVDLSGGKGITKVSDPQLLPAAIDKALAVTRSDAVVVEEFIEGSNHGYSTFIENGKVRFAFMDDEHYFINPYLVSGASTSLKYSPALATQLNTALETMVSRLNLCDGLLHVQFVLKEQIPYIIEICRRTPGDLYVKLVEYATGFDMSDAIVKRVLGLSIDNYAIGSIRYITRHCVMSETLGEIKGVRYGSFERRLFDKMVFFKQGDFIRDMMTYKAEIDFFRYEDKEDERVNIPRLEKEVRVQMKETIAV